MAISLKKILGTLTGKVAFERTGENFDTLESSFNALETVVGNKANDSTVTALQQEVAAHKADNVSAHGINLKANKTLGSQQSLTLQNGWAGNIVFRKNDVGIVTVIATTLTNTGIPDAVIATLPEGYRPIYRALGTVIKGNISPYDAELCVNIAVNGEITIRKPLLDLLTQNRNDGLSFSVFFQSL